MKILSKKHLLCSLACAGSVFAVDSTIRAYTFTTFGETDGDFDEVRNHNHDPSDEQAFQSLELEWQAEWNSYIKTFAALNGLTDDSDSSETELEEAYVTFSKLPFNLEARFGRFFNRLDAYNHLHNHGWDFVDANLGNALLVGEESLGTNGGEITWIGGDVWQKAFNIGFGEVNEHGHEEPGGGGHGHSDSAENAFLSDDVLSLSTLVKWSPNDYNSHQFNLSFVTGANGYEGGDRDTQIITADYSYLLKPGGFSSENQLRLEASVFRRNTEWLGESGQLGDSNQVGFRLAALYQFNPKWKVGFRYGQVDGAKDGFDTVHNEYALEVLERDRYSLVVERNINVSKHLNINLKAQYNHDVIEEDSTHEQNTGWLQTGIHFTY